LKPPRRRVRALLATLHLWVGIALCLPLVLLGLTGAILVYDQPIARFLGEAPPRAAVSDAAPLPVETLLAAASGAAPGLMPVGYMPGEAPGEVARVRLAQPGKPGPGGLVAFVDPQTGAVLGTRDPNAGVLRAVHLLHGNLGWRDRTGREAVGWLGGAMLLLGVSGIVLWWPRPGRWRQAFTVARAARGQRLHRELHGAVGIWSLVVFVIVSFSGTYLVFPATLGAAFGVTTAALVPKVDAPAGATPLPLDAGIAAARRAAGAEIVRLVGPPLRRDQPLRVQLARDGDDPHAPTISVFVDPFTAQVLELRDPTAQPAGRVFLAWQRALHAGRGLGPLWQAAVFLSGLLPPLFAVTGLSMWWLRRRARRATASRAAAALAAS
jgi:uncharacterized iron-regulated membrane protein